MAGADSRLAVVAMAAAVNVPSFPPMSSASPIRLPAVHNSPSLNERDHRVSGLQATDPALAGPGGSGPKTRANGTAATGGWPPLDY